MSTNSDKDKSGTGGTGTGNAATATTTTGAGTWTSACSMSTVRSNAAGICVNDHQFLVIGGEDDENFTLFSSCEYYDTITKEWNCFPIDMPSGRYGLGAAMVGTTVYAIGGIMKTTGSTTTTSVSQSADLISIDVSDGDLWALTARKWETGLAPMLQARSEFACVSHSEYIYVFGGNDDDDNALETAERYNTKTNKWESLPPMPTGKRYGCKAGVVGNKIYIVGGRTRAFRGTTFASTLVYDTSKKPGEKPWDSSTRFESSTRFDLNTPRSVMSVVVVDGFVLAIGGEMKKNNSLSTIEVFDTQRMTWKHSKIPLATSKSYHVAGYLKKTKEVIVAGGYNTDKVESFHVEKGLMPSFYVNFTERGQKVFGDEDHGVDNLGLKKIAEALAESLVFKDLKAPFVLGILGKWGKGKSFFFNLLKDHMITIQKKKVDEFVHNTYAGHIYVINFNAWTFSKGNILSSLMFQILKELNKQLQFEEKMGSKYLTDGAVSTIEVFRDFSAGEVQYLEKIFDGKIFEKIKNSLEDIKNSGDIPSEILMEAINVNYKEDKKNLKRIDEDQTSLKEEIREIEKEICEKRTHAMIIDLIESIKKELSYFGKNNFDEFVKESKSLEEINEYLERIEWFHYKFNISSSSIKMSGFCIILALLICLYSGLQKGDQSKIFGYSAAGLAASVGMATTLKDAYVTAVKEVSSITEKSQLILDMIVAESNDDVTEVSFAVRSVEDENPIDEKLKQIVANKQEIEKIKNRNIVLEGISLRDAISKIDSKKYEDKLGIAHNIHQDLQILSDGMLNKMQMGKEIFPRGDPRIVLFVDDLDRCEHSVVVKVIEALQLLVKTKLFVVILGIDPSYVTLSIEKHYKGVVDRRTPPSGMDFLEKIIQIPFRLPGISEDNVDEFLDGQITLESPKEDLRKDEGAKVGVDDEGKTPKKSGDGNDSVNDSVNGGTSTGPALVPETVQSNANKDQRKITEPNEVIVTEMKEEEVPNNQIPFTVAERDMLAELFKLFNVNPRCMRRIINVYKVLQIIWKRETSSKYEVDKNFKCATVFLMLLASDESTRDTAFKIFDWMESGTVKYHQVMWDGENGDEATGWGSKGYNLANLFQRELKKSDQSFESSFVNGASQQGTLMAAVDKYLGKYKWKDVSGWKQLSCQFRLARSFCFYRVAGEEIDEPTKESVE